MSSEELTILRKELSDIASYRFGCSGKTLNAVNDWFNERGRNALELLERTLSQPALPGQEPVANKGYWTGYSEGYNHGYAARIAPEVPDTGGLVSAQDPRMLLAGIKQFGLAADGSDLRDLDAAFAEAAAELSRLRAVNDGLQAEIVDCAVSLTAATEDNKRLREALTTSRTTLNELWDHHLHNTEAGCEAWADVGGEGTIHCIDAILAKNVEG